MNNRIRKLTIGTPEYGLSYQVDQIFNKGRDSEIKVSKIVIDIEYLLKFGVDKYDVYGIGKNGNEMIWKSFSRQKSIVEYEF